MNNGPMNNAVHTHDNEQRRRVRRSALLFGLVALAVYVTFIVYAVTHGHR
jgi:hypothetical protein